MKITKVQSSDGKYLKTHIPTEYASRLQMKEGNSLVWTFLDNKIDPTENSLVLKIAREK